MYTVTSTFEVAGITPEEAVNWWLSMTHEKYTRWHKDHRAWQWHSGDRESADQGDTVSFHEIIGRFDLKVKAKLQELSETGFLKFKINGAPATFAFRYEPTETGTRVTYTAELGFKSFPGRLLDGLIKKVYPPEEYGAAITGHVKEEHDLIKHQGG